MHLLQSFLTVGCQGMLRFGVGKMAELTLEPRIAAIVARNKISAEDTLFLRSHVYQDGLASRYEAENLFAMKSACAERAPEWSAFFIEAVCDYIVHQEKPSGYISGDNATWLMAMITRDGKIDSDTEIELLVRVLEASREAPAQLGTFALKQVELAVVTGNGPLAKGRTLKQGEITRDETDLVRRILYAIGGDGNIAVTRGEAEMLFEINDKSVDALTDPTWNELFVKAIANHLMAVSGYNVGSREDALRHDAFLDGVSAGMGGFLSRMLTGSFSERFKSWSKDNDVEDRFAQANAERAAQSDEAELIAQSEALWLAGRIGRDGLLHENERALVDFLRKESPNIHPDLMRAINKAA
jgi:hypothetical protein